MTEYFDILKGKLPKNVSDKFLNNLKRNLRIKELNKGDVLIEQGSIDCKVYFIAQGSFIQSVITSTEEEKTIMFHTESFLEFMICVDGYFFNQKASYQIKSNEKSVVYEFEYDFLHRKLNEEPIFLMFYTGYVEIYTANLHLFHNNQLALSSEDYLVWLHKNYSFLFQRFSSKAIANFMGITPVWLSNLKRKIIS